MNIFNLDRRSSWDVWLSLITLIGLLLSLLINITPLHEWIWLAAIMVFTGIPHGATDHLVHWHQMKQSGKPRNWLRFLVPYLSQMLLYGILWYIIPAISLLIFLILTFYHFGQSELYYIDLPETNIIKKTSYLLWGGGVMVVLLLGHPVEAIPYLEGIISTSWLNVDAWKSAFPIALGGITGSIFLLLAWFRFNGLISRVDFLREIFVTFLLYISLYYCSLWIGFGLYFGIWHATKAIRAEMSLFESENKGWTLKNWILQALPFSLLSFFGLGILVLAWSLWGQAWHPVFLFFVGVSVLTFPHMLTLEHVYKSQIPEID